MPDPIQYIETNFTEISRVLDAIRSELDATARFPDVAAAMWLIHTRAKELRLEGVGAAVDHLTVEAQGRLQVEESESDSEGD